VQLSVLHDHFVVAAIAVSIGVGSNSSSSSSAVLNCSSTNISNVYLWFSRLSDQLCVWADINSVHRAKYMATVSFLRTQTGMKSRLDLACAYQQLSQDENFDHGEY
jgi:hypothetical protein